MKAVILFDEKGFSIRIYGYFIKEHFIRINECCEGRKLALELQKTVEIFSHFVPQKNSQGEPVRYVLKDAVSSQTTQEQRVIERWLSTDEHQKTPWQKICIKNFRCHRSILISQGRKGITYHETAELKKSLVILNRIKGSSSVVQLGLIRNGVFNFLRNTIIASCWM
jgi:hypothetical protein